MFLFCSPVIVPKTYLAASYSRQLVYKCSIAYWHTDRLNMIDVSVHFSTTGTHHVLMSTHLPSSFVSTTGTHHVLMSTHIPSSFVSTTGTHHVLMSTHLPSSFVSTTGTHHVLMSTHIPSSFVLVFILVVKLQLSSWIPSNYGQC